MSENDKVIHLPSGDELRSCAECGCAVLDLDAHRRWHGAVVKQIEQAAFGIVEQK